MRCLSRVRASSESRVGAADIRTRVVLVSAVALLAGCASSPLGPPANSPATDSSIGDSFWPTSGDVRESGHAAVVQPWDSTSVETLALAKEPFAEPPPELSTLSSGSFLTIGSLPAVREPESDDSRRNYLSLKGGPLYPSDSEFSTGYIINAAYGTYFTRLFSLEFEAGYADPDLDVTPSADMYAVPLMVNGRVNLPLWFLQAYGGLGLGAMYYNVDDGGFDGDGWVGAGSAFLGGDITLFDRLSGGLEVKYYKTEELRNSDVSLDSVAVLLTVGFRF